MNALKSTMIGIIVAMAAEFGGWQEVSAQSELPLFQYTVRPTGFGAREEAFARAYTAEAIDVTSMYWNPAALSFLRTNAVSVSHIHDWEAQGYTEIVATPIVLSQGNTIGIGASVSHFGYVGTKPVGGAQFSNFGLDLGYSVNVMPTLSIGTVLSLRYSSAAHTSLAAGWVSLGAFYYPSPDFSYGLAIHSAGTEMTYSVFPSGVRLERAPLEQKSVEIGATMRFPTRGTHPIVTMSMSNQRSFPDNTYRVMGGIEVAPFDFLALRIGYGGNPSSVAGHYGMGLSFKRFRLDYAISPSRSEVRYDTATLSYVFGSK